MPRLVRPFVAAALTAVVAAAIACQPAGPAPLAAPAPAVKECRCSDCGCDDCVRAGKPCACPTCSAGCAVAVKKPARACGNCKKPCCGE